MTYRKKLIEVALPLDEINYRASREKSIRHGHPSTLHLWWSRKPLAVCRAMLFASLVDDPSSRPELSTKEEQERERKHLFAKDVNLEERFPNRAIRRESERYVGRIDLQIATSVGNRSSLLPLLATH